MTYENEKLAEIDSKLREANTLLNSCKNQLSDENIRAAFERNLNRLEGFLQERVQALFTARENQFNQNLRSEIERLFEQEKESLIHSLSQRVNFEDIFNQNRAHFVKLNEDKLKEALRVELGEEKYSAVITNFSRTLESLLDNARERLRERLENFDLAQEAHGLFRAAFEDIVSKIIRAKLSEQKEMVVKVLSSYLFLDEEISILMRSSIEQAVGEMVRSEFTQKRLNEQVKNQLLSLNKELANHMLNSIQVTKLNFKKDLLLGSSVLKNCLTRINENLKVLNELKTVELRRAALESPDIQEVIQRRLKVE